MKRSCEFKGNQDCPKHDAISSPFFLLTVGSPDRLLRHRQLHPSSLSPTLRSTSTPNILVEPH